MFISLWLLGVCKKGRIFWDIYLDGLFSRQQYIYESYVMLSKE
jgi:hypothetical protein